jgi:ComF family protein
VFRHARAALRYDEQARRLILPLKHADRLELATVLAPMMVRAGAALLARADVLVPVPLHRRRLFQRKYNQAAVLAFAVGRLADQPVLPDALIRIRRTAPLDEKSPEERMREVAGALGTRPSRAGQVAGKTVLLVDDVMTSGATANACATVLLEAGAVAVDVLVAARVPDPRLKS